jgi:photosystem II stability/assembly factor-like uncharacterized protein
MAAVALAAAVAGAATGVGLGLHPWRANTGRPTPLSAAPYAASPEGVPSLGAASATKPPLPPLSSPCAAPTSQGTPTLIDDLSMFSPTAGWAQEVAGGTILHTTNGAQLWTAASPPLSGGQQILAVSFVSAEIARAVTGPLSSCDGEAPPAADLSVWGTQDGGATWSADGTLMAPTLFGATLDFVNSLDGWLSIGEGGGANGSGMVLYHTVDGGADWQEVASTDSASAQLAEGISLGAAGSIPIGFDVGTISFIDASTGWITGTTGGTGAVLAVTGDGGTTWSSQPLPGGAGLVQPGITAPHFWSGQGGWLLVYAPATQQVLIYLTTDGGQDWSPISLPGGGQIPVAVDFVAAAVGWVLTDAESEGGQETSQTLWATVNGGGSWEPVSGDAALSTLDFVDAEDGWAITTADTGEAAPGSAVPALLQTTDGGATWTAVSVGMSAPPASP